MRIALVTPYLPESRNGNAHTAVRWRRFLRAAGHRVELLTDWRGQTADALIALHARRSHASVRAWAEARPDHPLILVLTGTDLYCDIHTDAQAKWSLTVASRLVVLQERGVEELPPALRAKAVILYQSAPAITSGRRPARHFDVCVTAHLRDEKAPFLAAEALSFLPDDSRIRVRHIGGELQPGMAARAAALAAEQARWRWLGAQPHGATRRRIADSHLLVISSHMEGGANVIVEAVTAGTPVLASRIPGNVGMLGADYAGYFPVGDASALAALLHRAETDPAYYIVLQTQCAARAPLFTPEREAAGVRALLETPT
ncbi:MAG: TIGR04348 family glycosyltransferase [Betaproteobacteria bacterium]|nr:TIGR04348 family glycosyltransferase [Betaproteobacteria bacterium]